MDNVRYKADQLDEGHLSNNCFFAKVKNQGAGTAKLRINNGTVINLEPDQEIVLYNNPVPVALHIIATYDSSDENVILFISEAQNKC